MCVWGAPPYWSLTRNQTEKASISIPCSWLADWLQCDQLSFCPRLDCIPSCELKQTASSQSCFCQMFCYKREKQQHGRARFPGPHFLAFPAPPAVHPGVSAPPAPASVFSSFPLLRFFLFNLCTLFSFLFIKGSLTFI